MADIPIKFYKSIVRSQKFNPSNPPDLEDPAPVVNPPGTVPTTLYKLLGDVTDSSFIGKNGYVPVVAGENVLTLQNLDDKYVTIATAQTITGAKIFENILSLSSSASNRGKLRILSGSPDWIIGIQALTTYGRLNNTAITFQVPNVNAQGWWWGDAAHTTAQGAMALTNQGDVTIARSIRVGGGESDVSKPISFNLDVQGSAFLGDAIVQGNLRLNSLASGTGDVLLINGSNDVVRGSGITQLTGTFIPTLTDNGGGYVYTLSSSNGYYIKTGKFVFFNILINITSTSGSPLGGLLVGNLPFLSSNVSTNISGIIVHKIIGTDWSTSLLNMLTCSVNTNSTEIGFSTLTSSVGNFAPSITSGTIRISGSYISES